MKRKYTPRNSAQNKADLLAMAREGQKRPYHASFLGNRLEAYISINRNYDEKFASEIRCIAPHWFPELRTKRNKAILLHMAKSGHPMPTKDTELGKKLRLYIHKGHTHDLAFTKEITKYWN